MKKSILFSFCLLSSAVNADVTKGGYIGCTSEDALDQFTTASVKKDVNAVNHLLKRSCMSTKAGLKITVLERSWATAKIRVYVGENSLVLWTPKENILRN